MRSEALLTSFSIITINCEMLFEPELHCSCFVQYTLNLTVTVRTFREFYYLSSKDN